MILGGVALVSVSALVAALVTLSMQAKLKLKLNKLKPLRR